MPTSLSFFYVKKKKQKKDTTRANRKIGLRTSPPLPKPPILQFAPRVDSHAHKGSGSLMRRFPIRFLWGLAFKKMAWGLCWGG